MSPLDHEALIAEIAAKYVDDEKGIELDDLMQEGRLAAWLITERLLTEVRPWHIKLVMASWSSHIRNHEVPVDTEVLVRAAMDNDLGPPAESDRSRLMRKSYLNGGVLTG